MSEVNRTQNRGVNITSEDFAQVELENDAAVPQSRLKLDLHNIIDFIDTNTPHFRYTSSSLDADNEESLISSAPSIRSAVRHQSDSQNDTLELVSHGSESCNTITELSCEKSLGIPTPILYSTNTNCPCLHSKGPLPQFPVNSKVPYRKVYNGKEKRFMLPDLFEKWVGKDRKDTSTPEELYRINIQTKDECSPPTRLVFDLIEVVPKHVTSTGTNTKHIARENLQKNGIKCKYAPMGCNVQHSNYSGVVVTPRNTTKWKYPNWYKNLHKQRVNHKKPKPNPTRMDVYYFDHGNAAYYQTTDSPPTITTELVAEKTESYAKKFWAEIFD
ncbi:hypothetical protein PPYR_06693 [Photinus pyralis]|uniref:Uncharacterized protein n=1 Tax=Photinus pyralis TaxID=7054 RepID=A0A5N4ANF6_PHOPY|nr:hypothetical protein PPYR_06693 [Photinus pyralis]